MSEKFLMEDVETGKQVEIEVDYQKILACPANGVITIGGKKYRKNGRLGNLIKIRPESQPIKNHGVTNRKTFAAGVHREQVPEARELAKTLHPGIEIANNGDVLCGSRKARAVWLKSQGLRDNDGGYSD